MGNYLVFNQNKFVLYIQYSITRMIDTDVITYREATNKKIKGHYAKTGSKLLHMSESKTCTKYHFSNINTWLKKSFIYESCYNSHSSYELLFLFT